MSSSNMASSSSNDIGFTIGNGIMSLIVGVSVKSMQNLSIPIPNPPVGGEVHILKLL